PIAIVLLFFLCVTACKKEMLHEEAVEVCGVSDPIHNLEWLNAEYELLVGGPEMNGVILYQYEGRDVIEIQSSVFSSFNGHQYYCDGTKLELDGNEAFEKFLRERVLVSVLYGTDIWKGEWLDR